MTIDTKKLREQMSDWRKYPPTDRHPSYILDDIAPQVIAVLDQLEAAQKTLDGIAYGLSPGARNAGHIRADHRQRLQAIRSARDEACEIAEAATFVIDNGLCERCRGSIENVDVERIDALRKV